MNVWLFAGISVLGLVVVTAKPGLLAKTGLVKIEDLTKNNIRLLQAFFVVFALVVSAIALSSSGGADGKQRLRAEDIILDYEKKIFSAESGVTSAHEQYIGALETVGRGGKAHMLDGYTTVVAPTLNNAISKTQAANESITTLTTNIKQSTSLDAELKQGMLVIIENVSKSFSLRNESYELVLRGIQALSESKVAASKLLLKESTSKIHESEAAMMHAALMLAAVKEKAGIKVQK